MLSIDKKIENTDTHDFESEHNLIGLFKLLYDIDKQKNQSLYEKVIKEKT